MSTIAPVRSADQRMAALGKANRIRVYRAALKREIAAGERSIVEVLADPDERLAGMKLVDLLLAVPKVGKVKAKALLREMRISHVKTVGGLSSRQRAELEARFRRS